jgi:DNA-binding NtrC family response regulator
LLRTKENNPIIMNKLNQVLLVDNDLSSNSEKENLIKKSGISQQVKITVNGGHALLYLDQISHKLNDDSKIVILLNMDTPIVNGFDFLNGYKTFSSVDKKNILIIVIEDNLCSEKIEKARGLGVCNFINSGFSIDTFNQIVDNHFELSAAFEMKPLITKKANAKKKIPMQAGFNNA